MKKLLLFSTLLFAATIFAQNTFWDKWRAKTVNAKKHNFRTRWISRSQWITVLLRDVFVYKRKWFTPVTSYTKCRSPRCFVCSLVQSCIRVRRLRPLRPAGRRSGQRNLNWYAWNTRGLTQVGMWNHKMLQPDWGMARLESRRRSWQAAISRGERHESHGSANCWIGPPGTQCHSSI